MICTSLEAAGIFTTFPIQALTLPLAIGGNDIIGQARTGTGKTLAFGVPMLHRLALARAEDSASGRKAPVGLIVLPTRELAIQVAAELTQAGKNLGARILTVYGGRAYEPQIDALKAGVDIVVGTPGRLLDLANRKNLDLSQVRSLVLDEADKMLDLGFLPDVERILRQTPDDRQTMLFSATMPGEVVTLARRHMRRPTNIRADHGDVMTPPPLTKQYVYRTHHLDKIEVLARLLQAKDRGLAMVFCHTKRAVDQVSTALDERGFATAAVHGDLGQSQRERSLRAFRAGKVDVLVATDVAARGIDVDDVTHVVNYECPDDEKDYVHRVGRTGRAGRAGVAVTFVDWANMQRWKLISTTLGLDLPEPAETYSTSEHLYTELSIPPDVTGRLPVALRERAGLAAEEEEDLGETGRTRSRKPSERAPRKERTRTRRGGQPGDAGDGTTVAGEAEATRSGTDGDAPPRARRRRRLRGGQAVPADGEATLGRDGAPRDDQAPRDNQAPRDTAQAGPGNREAAPAASAGSDAPEAASQVAAATDAPPKRATRSRSRKRAADAGGADFVPGRADDQPARGDADQGDTDRGNTARDGSARDGSARDGSAHSGSARDGSARSGSARDDSARDDSARDDSTRNGTARGDMA
ncbi:MAG TPA: DEAD/DEAH box helicase, partial [Trebonia sp.]|nr:DEAD/DEAH box helicase [Trebonia sp.]